MSTFQLINQFVIDQNRLLNDWQNLTAKYNIFYVARKYPRLLITYPTGYSDNIDIVNFTDVLTVPEFNKIAELFTVENIVKDFKNTYTEKVVNDVAEFLLPKFSTTVVKYAGLAPNFKMGMHTDDISANPRFMLLVAGNDQCYMDTETSRHAIDKIGGLYMLDRQQPHNPINLGSTWRIMIHFDVVTNNTALDARL